MVRVGILGTARIARAFFDAPLHGVEIAAVASRVKSRGEAFAREFNIPLCCGSYEQLLAERDIDAVYIPLPQHLHCEYTIKAAQAGKHVLVEKPAALTSAEVHSMIDVCKEHDVFLMEAFMYRFKRIQKRLKEIIVSGRIGRVRTSISIGASTLARCPAVPSEWIRELVEVRCMIWEFTGSILCGL